MLDIKQTNKKRSYLASASVLLRMSSIIGVGSSAERKAARHRKSRRLARAYISDLEQYNWCRRPELNQQPTDDKSVALPLSHAGIDNKWWAILGSNQ